MDDPYCTIFKSVKLKNKIKDCLKRSYSEDEANYNYKLLTIYWTAQILCRNSQQSGVIENVKINEYLEMNVNHEGNPVIQCLNHKTSLEGPAQLVLNKLTNQLLDKYYKLVRCKITPQKDCEPYLFLTTSGAKYKQVYRKMATKFQRTGITGIDIPTPSQ